ncbi:MAG: helix-turn-helix domain-containing protein [Gammaproteobacteria bacterium]|nr:helix-turn-helix domain-containing protein [Gammaproteobacteria bacterium]NNJ49795.1 helix-turn-helix domain-containing protein [Gammaproteobacteria bacterium]
MSSEAVNPAANGTADTEGVGYAQPSLEVLSCKSCNASGNCLVEQMTIRNGHSYQLMKNRKVYLRGEHMYRAEDEADALYVVSSGSVKSYVIMEDGEEQVLNFYHTGDVVGLDGMGADSYISSAISLETSTICKLPLSNLPEAGLGRGFLHLVSDRLIRDHNLMLMLARKDADGRMASFLVNISKHFKKLGQSADVFELTMTRQDIANYLGLAIETVSRTLRRFQDSGMLVVTRRKIQIYDFDCLLEIAGTQVSR